MSVAFLELANHGIQQLSPYVPGKSEADIQRELGLSQVIKLASNENPLGPSQQVIAAVTAALGEGHRYPDGAAVSLREKLVALHLNNVIQAEQITFGNGSSEILELALRVFVASTDEVIFSAHAFALYPLLTQALGAKAKVIAPNAPDHAMPYGHNLSGFLQAINDKTKLIFIANPNNPTGTWLTKTELYDFIQQVPEHIIIVLDEAYFDYANAMQDDYPNGAAWVNQFPNLIVTRTFSKAYGLAAYRVGYGMSSVEIADLMNRIRPPFNVNMYAQVAAIAALEDQQYLQASIQSNQSGLQTLQNYCKQKGLRYLPSAANFLSIEFGVDTAALNQALLHEGVIVRPNSGYQLPSTLRMSIGTESENQRLIQALDKHKDLYAK